MTSITLPKVFLIGDVLEDRFPIFDADVARDEDRLFAAKRPGGALFVRSALADAFVKLFGGDVDTALSRIATFRNLKDLADEPAGYTEWEIFKPESGILRCKPRPRARQDVTFNKDDDFAGYERSIKVTDILGCDIAIIEDLGLENVIINATKQLDFNPKSRSYVTATVQDPRKSRLAIDVLLASLQVRAKKAEDAHDFSPLLFVMINRELPNPHKHKKSLWSKLLSGRYGALLKRTVAVVYADTLRWSGVHISKQISWERSAQDFLSQWYTHPILKLFQNVGHFLVRFGVTGFIYSYSLGRRQVHRIFFDPCAKEVGIYRDMSRTGDIVGHQTVTLCHLVTTMTRSGCVRIEPSPNGSPKPMAEVADCVGVAIRRSLKHCQALFDRGLGSQVSGKPLILNIKETPFQLLLPKWSVKTDSLRGADGAEEPPSPIGEERIPVGCPAWNILTQAAEYELPQLARRLVLDGIPASLNSRRQLAPLENVDPNVKLSPNVPVIEFGTDPVMYVVDRREIETYRTVRNMLCKAVAGGLEHPLCVAMFGPPGAGKTFTIRKIVESALQGQRKMRLHPINMAGEKDFSRAKSIIDEAFKERGPDSDYPVVFFDEFDSAVEGVSLGWLKYFLAPMEDKGNALFVFAGGTSFTYRDFTREDVSLNERERADFKMRKGPDFVSRLRGHIDILGPNKVDPTDDGYIIRRAITLRSMFEVSLSKLIVGEDRVERTSSILEYVGEDLVNAMLDIPRYKHSSRSMQAVIDMCVRLGGEKEGRYVSSTLPTQEQLDMHVDGAAFLAYIDRARTSAQR